MAQVVQDSQLHSRIEHYLDYLTRAWEGVPLDAREWDEWDDLSQLTFVVDWGVPADRLDQLQRWAAEGRLTPEQCIRYDALLVLVERYRRTLDRMLQDEPE